MILVDLIHSYFDFIYLISVFKTKMLLLLFILLMYVYKAFYSTRIKYKCSMIHKSMAFYLCGH